MVRSALFPRVSNHESVWRSFETRPSSRSSGCGREFVVTFDDVRKFALAWPEVEDGMSYGTPALKVRKKLLARLREDGDSLVMPGVPQDERDMLVERAPQLFYFTDHYRDYPMVLIRLSKGKRTDVESLLRRHWRTLASKKAVKASEV
jgi:hypothetical protein